MTGLALPPITGALDERIAPLVHALRAAGFPTSASCDGDSSWQRVPWVNVEAASGGPLAMGIMRAILVRWLRDRGIVANVCECHTTLQGEPGFPFVRLEVLSDLAEAKL